MLQHALLRRTPSLSHTHLMLHAQTHISYCHRDVDGLGAADGRVYSHLANQGEQASLSLLSQPHDQLRAAPGMSDDEGEVYAYSDDGGSDVDYAYGSDEVSLGV